MVTELVKKIPKFYLIQRVINVFTKSGAYRLAIEIVVK
jgi:hypothetical protein